MTQPADLSFHALDLEKLVTAKGCIAVFADADGKLDQGGRRINRVTRGALARLCAAKAWAKAEDGSVHAIGFAPGVQADVVAVVRMPQRADAATMRRAGANLVKAAGDAAITVWGGPRKGMEDFALGAVLRRYAFTARKSAEADPVEPIAILSEKVAPDAAASVNAVAEGVFFTRDLTNEPANVLTTTEFADRLAALGDLGVKVTVLEEDELARLGMHALLGVGQGSRAPSKVAIMEWKGAAQDQPLALVGKGVVFDTGGISLKPAAGMEDMTMDMGGAAVVAGVMKTLALRKARANVVGLVGLVENMPDGMAQRPGDVVTSMKGDTIEVINTDAEGRLVLADVMWLAQERFRPSAMIDLATLTGAIIIGLGHENAGVFSNSDDLCGDFLKAAQSCGEGAWRMPLGAAYDKQLKSDIADMKNVGGRPAGSVTAAQFLKRFVKDDTPWIHLDIAGVASLKSASELAPKGATGWGVRTLDRLIRDRYEA